ncbi:MAG: alkaline phosphatase [Phycisphaeraceae bacterium]
MSTQSSGGSRREFLKGAAVAAAGLGLGGQGSIARGQVEGGSTRWGGKARNIVFMVSDGMSQGTWTMADMAHRLRSGRRSFWASLMMEGMPSAQVMTHSKNSLVTDSAAGGSAWGSGVHLNNGEINRHGGKDYEPILVTARKAGMGTGLVTTTRVTHATPASFVANVDHRDMEDEIAEQMMTRGVDVVLGGGARYFPDELLTEYEDVTVVRTATDLAIKRGVEGRLLGLFNDSHLAYELDRPADEPSLRAMSMVALEKLAAREAGFVLQIEGGRVDHGGHGTDAPANLFDQLAFDEAVEAVVGWARRRGDTLVIVTTDHGCGGPELTLYQEEGNEGFAKLLTAKSTVTAVQMKAGREADRVDRLIAGFRDDLDIELSAAEQDYLRGSLGRDREGEGFKGLQGDSRVISTVLANHWGVSFVSGNHTAEMVHATAVGPGSGMLRPMMDNVEFYELMTEAMGLRG